MPDLWQGHGSVHPWIGITRTRAAQQTDRRVDAAKVGCILDSQCTLLEESHSWCYKSGKKTGKNCNCDFFARRRIMEWRAEENTDIMQILSDLTHCTAVASLMSAKSRPKSPCAESATQTHALRAIHSRAQLAKTGRRIFTAGHHKIENRKNVLKV